MWNSDQWLRGLYAGVLMASAMSPRAAMAQVPAQGFAFERLYSSAPGAGWFVMDSLDMHGGLGGAVALTAGDEHNPVHVPTSPGAPDLSVVSTAGAMDFGLAATYERYRAYMNFAMPIRYGGDNGVAGNYSFTAPDLVLGSSPDTVGDVRLGADARLLGDAGSPFRLGAGAQLYIPNDARANYDTDATFRAMLRLLLAGDQGIFTYAGQAGVHIRPLNNAPIPQSPRGSELLFGLAGGVKLPAGSAGRFVVGSELYGASAFQSFLDAAETDKEWLLSTRYESTGSSGRQARVKLGFGRGINPQFGAPSWRVVASVELFGWAKE